MRIDELPSPGSFSSSYRLKAEVAKAISFSEIGQIHSPNKTVKSTLDLLNFLEAATERVRGMVKEETKPSKKTSKENEE